MVLFSIKLTKVYSELDEFLHYLLKKYASSDSMFA